MNEEHYPQIDGSLYVPHESLREARNAYVQLLNEHSALKEENACLKKENTRLKRLERRQQSKWERERMNDFVEPKEFTPFDLANHIVTHQIEIGKPINAIVLQKTMFFVACEYMSYLNKPLSLFDGKEETKPRKWKFGAVYPAVYDEYSFYGSLDITDIPFTQLFDWKPEELDGKLVSKGIDLSLLNEWIERYTTIDKWSLVEMSHSHQNWRMDEVSINAGDNSIAYDLEELYSEIENNPYFFRIPKRARAM